MFELLATMFVGFGLVWCGYRLGFSYTQLQTTQMLSEQFIREHSATVSAALLEELSDNGVIDRDKVVEYYKKKHKESPVPDGKKEQ